MFKNIKIKITIILFITSSLNVMGGAVGASSHPSARTACMSCTRSCDPKCPITLADEDGCKADGQQQQQG